MKLKAGRELSQLEIIKRLNLMEIEYNPNIMGKKYYIDLYNKAIQSSQNVEKIKNDVEKDKMYMDFYNQKLKKKNECSFEIAKIKNNNKNKLQTNNNYNKYILCDTTTTTTYGGKKNFNFFSNFNNSLMNKIVIGHLCFTTYDYAINNKNDLSKIVDKIMIHLNEIKKTALIKIYPDIKKRIIDMFNIIENSIADKYSFIPYLLFIILLYILLFIINKKRK
jgi:hypothetical protein